jgi:hypothetical protein
MIEPSGQLFQLMETATQLSESRALLAAFHAAIRDPEVWALATRDPAGLLGAHEVEIPRGLDIIFTDDPTRAKPVPDHEFFTIRLFNCRSYWLKKLDGEGYEEVEVCRGFEIVPHGFPGGPIG